jgi:hypothetical protein
MIIYFVFAIGGYIGNGMDHDSSFKGDGLKLSEEVSLESSFLTGLPSASIATRFRFELTS